MWRTTIAIAVFGMLAGAAEIYFPPNGGTSWAKAATSGWDSEKLERVLEFAKARRSTGVVILLNGKILAERQWDPPQEASAQYRMTRAADGQILEDVASVQKSITAMLFGIARRKGLIDFDTPPALHLGSGWTRASPEQESRITMRHLLSMTSGLSDELEFQAVAGTQWRYNSPAYQKIMRILAKAAGKSENQLTREWLTGAIGMVHSHWQERTNAKGMLGFVTSAREMARFGLLIQNQGVWSGRTVIEDRAYLREALQPSQRLNPSYGLLWWLNGHPVVRAGGGKAETLISSAPADLVAALGALGRKIYVAPSLGIVATRTGSNSDLPGEPSFDQEFWKHLMAARAR